jgi:glucarate dehydratase
MRINEMRITPIAVSDPPILNAAGMHAPYALRTVIELLSDDRISGVSEIPGSARTNAMLDRARDVVVGCDPFNLNTIAASLDARFGESRREARGDRPWDQRVLTHVFSAIEVACLDLVGKAIGRPVTDLLGGAVRERIPFAAYLFYKPQGAGGELGFDIDPNATGWAAARQARAMNPAEIVTQARAMCDEFGFRGLKLKAGVIEPDIEVETMFALREAFGPNVPLRIDPNASWSLETASRCGKKLEGILEYFEDPVRGQHEMAALRSRVNTPLATNMCTTSFGCLPESIKCGSEDIILSDHHFWGGLRASVELARICRTFGRGVSMHSNSHLGISMAAMTQLAAAVPNLTYSLDTHYPWQSDDVIVGGRFKFDDGSIRVSREPGLGVELDRAMLATLHDNYIRCGLTERDDEIEMQKLEPGWKFKPVRW